MLMWASKYLLLRISCDLLTDRQSYIFMQRKLFTSLPTALGLRLSAQRLNDLMLRHSHKQLTDQIDLAQNILKTRFSTSPMTSPRPDPRQIRGL